MDEYAGPSSRFDNSERAGTRHARRRSRRENRSAHRSSGPRRRGRLATRVAAGALSAVVLAGTAVGWATESSFDNGFGRSDAIGDGPRSLGGDLNILLIGLDSRKDLNGDDLPKQVLDKLHAGDGQEGGYNANTLILVHIPADMKKITAVSIPRDDYVKVSGIPGYTNVKIKEAYGLKKAAVHDQLAAQGMTDQKAMEFAAREAGRASVVNAVRDLTGVPIDRFAEVNLAGFYDLSQALGGVEVCLKKPVRDLEYSGADFPAGRQRLNPEQSLAFVRQRHGLENGDLDRTHRQQAFLTSVALDLRKSGTFTDVGKLSALMDAAHRDVVLSQGWNVTDFLRTLGAAGSPAVEFRTLPILRYDIVDGQEVNIVDPAAIRREVAAAFSATPMPAQTSPTGTVDVSNSGAADGMAATLSAALSSRGYTAGAVGNGTTMTTTSTIYYPSGGEADAKRLADTLGLPVAESASVATGRLKVVLGSDFTLPADLTTTPVATSGTPDAGKPVDTVIAGDSIPCVN
ncbi:LCP family protein [Nocardia goodfellowii]|uniref:LCP family protein required for cell wall assembly n=1 Tax=Nocardia goodfellowii TaxID=882446 RepID=A0ABS4QQW6_9NOCA|nr:LCP family protein [Nocardia goodfellowii]MBP2194080.1 LCP family protein required for cell wall assembly [Nocardia goodfellowii]